MEIITLLFLLQCMLENFHKKVKRKPDYQIRKKSDATNFFQWVSLYILKSQNSLSGI